MNNNHQLAKLDRYIGLAEFAGQSFHCAKVTQNMVAQDKVLFRTHSFISQDSRGDNSLEFGKFTSSQTAI
jgi:hypothetical protein